MYPVMHLATYLQVATSIALAANSSRCHSQPGDASFPTRQELSAFNSSVNGRLIQVLPSGKVCRDLPGGCTDAVWRNSIFNGAVPGAMLQVKYCRWFICNAWTEIILG